MAFLFAVASVAGLADGIIRGHWIVLGGVLALAVVNGIWHRMEGG